MKPICKPGLPGQGVNFRERRSLLLKLLNKSIQFGLTSVDLDLDTVRSIPDPALKPKLDRKIIHKWTKTNPLNYPCDMDKGARLLDHR